MTFWILLGAIVLGVLTAVLYLALGLHRVTSYVRWITGKGPRHRLSKHMRCFAADSSHFDDLVGKADKVCVMRVAEGTDGQAGELGYFEAFLVVANSDPVNLSRGPEQAKVLLDAYHVAQRLDIDVEKGADWDLGV